jgi:hypothetical protein
MIQPKRGEVNHLKGVFKGYTDRLPKKAQTGEELSTVGIFFA